MACVWKMLVYARKTSNNTAGTAIKKTLGALDKLKSATAVGAILEEDQGKLVRRLFKDEIEMDSLLECFWPNEPNLNPLGEVRVLDPLPTGGGLQHAIARARGELRRHDAR